MNKNTVVKIAVVTIIFLPTVAAFILQNNRYTRLNNENRQLSTSLNELKTTYETIKNASLISTDNWKPYCDTIKAFCFKYPPDWSLTDGGIDERGYAGATIINPDKTIAVRYINPLVKDGGYHSAHIVDISDTTQPIPELKIIGSYAVASTAFEPEYSIINTSATEGQEEGGLGRAIINPRFDYGKYSGVMFATERLQNNRGINSKAKAEAWFQSIEGRTVQAILSSLTVQ